MCSFFVHRTELLELIRVQTMRALVFHVNGQTDSQLILRSEATKQRRQMIM